jgi:outer membrane protein assembly factor BamB
MVSLNFVFVGLNGSVTALDRSTGTVIWATRLKGSDFVNVLLTEDELYATTKGEAYCLDPGTGQIRWHNPLKGMGVGLVCIAAPGSQGNQAAPMKRKRDQDAAETSAAVVAAGS